MNPAEHIDANVPADIRDFSIWFCETYGVSGICDPMWVCNVTAMHLGRGDGQGHFEGNTCDDFDVACRVAYRRLYHAYTTCIIDSGQDHMRIYTELTKLRAV